jgi:hypothetical protein
VEQLYYCTQEKKIAPLKIVLLSLLLHFFLFHNAQADSAAHPASYPMHGGLFPRGYRGRDVKLTATLHSEPRSRKVELYIYSPICLRDIAALN